MYGEKEEWELDVGGGEDAERELLSQHAVHIARLASIPFGMAAAAMVVSHTFGLRASRDSLDSMHLPHCSLPPEAKTSWPVRLFQLQWQSCSATKMPGFATAALHNIPPSGSHIAALLRFCLD